MQWPGSLKELTFGRCFNQPVEDVRWPSSLLRLRFGGRFSQPVQGAVWPASLEEVQAPGSFGQPIAGIAWPSSLKRLTFGPPGSVARPGVASARAAERTAERDTTAAVSISCKRLLRGARASLSAPSAMSAYVCSLPPCCAFSGAGRRMQRVRNGSVLSVTGGLSVCRQTGGRAGPRHQAVFCFAFRQAKRVCVWLSMPLCRCCAS